MKRYASRATKLFAIATLICGAVVLIGIIIAFAGVKNIGLPIGFILSGGFLGVIFFACFFAVNFGYYLATIWLLKHLKTQNAKNNSH